MTRLHNGQTFPRLEIAEVGGTTITLPDDLAGSFGVVLLYRGAWCPYCNAQLAAFSSATDRFAELGIEVVALSVEDEAAAVGLIEQHALRFRVGRSADADAIAAATGAYVNADPHHLQSTGFVLAPDGSVVNAVYSSGAIGRLTPDDVAGLVSYLAAAAGAV